jgi:hypothetical protein
MEFDGAAILSGVVNPHQFASGLVECAKETVARTDEEKIPRDRRGSKNSTASFRLPKNCRCRVNVLRKCQEKEGSNPQHEFVWDHFRLRGHRNFMNITLFKALAALVPVCMLLFGAIALFVRGKSASAFLQLLGAGGLVAVVLTHVCEALHLFPWMQWGLEHSIGHYLDLWSAVLGGTFFPVGYLVHALTKRRA